MTLSEVLHESIKTQGRDVCLNIAMEEPAELIQAISKMRRYENSEIQRRHLIEEIGDTVIGINYLIEIYDLRWADIFEVMDKKQERIIEIIDTIRSREGKS